MSEPAIPVFLYARISKDVALEEGMRTDRQLAALADWCQRNGRIVLASFSDDDLSASPYAKKVRPGYQAMLRRLRMGDLPAGGELLAVELTRLTRSGKDAIALRELLQERRLSVQTLRDGRFELRTAKERKRWADDANEAEYESARLSERVLDAKLYDRTQGRWIGGAAPFGFVLVAAPGRRGSTLAVDKVAAAEVREMARKLLAGWTLAAICDDLNGRGVKSPRGKAWSRQHVGRLLRQDAIAGRIKLPNGKTVRGEWDAILDDATVASVSAKLATNAAQRVQPSRSYLLTGLVFSKDGERCRANPARGTRWYRATGVGDLPGMEAPAEKLEEDTVELAFRWSDLHALTMPTSHPDSGIHDRVAEARQALAEAREFANDAGLEGADFVRAIRQEIAAVKEAESAAVVVVTDAYATASAVLSVRGGLRTWWAAVESLDARRQMLGFLFERIVVYPRWDPVVRADPLGSRVRWIWSEQIPAEARLAA